MRIRMTKEVLVTISGLQFSPETESESVELITSGSYYKKMENIISSMMKSTRDFPRQHEISSN